MINIDWTLLVQAVNFFILLGLLHWVLYRPLRKVIDCRQDEIKGSLDRVRELEEDISGKQAVYKEKVESVRDEARQQREEMRHSVASKQAQLLSAAHGQVEASRDSIRERIAAQRSEAAALLKDEANRLAAAITRKIAGRSL
ncbi:MAG: ATP synthase F0 subunit B [Syntrophotaleaceae bacterium]